MSDNYYELKSTALTDQYHLGEALAGSGESKVPGGTEPEKSQTEPHPDAGKPADPVVARPSDALTNDPEYQQACEYTDMLAQLAFNKNGLAAIDHGYGNGIGGGKDDGQIDRGNVKDAANDPNASPELRRIAQMLDQTPGLFSAISKGKDLISLSDVTALYNEMKAKKKSMEEADTHPPQPTPPDSTNAAPGADATGAPDSGGATQLNSDGTVKLDPPFSSSKTGMDRTADALGYVTDNIKKVETALADAAASGDQKKISLLTAQRAQLMFGQQALMSLTQQQQESTSALLKMYAEMAKNAISNMR